MSDWKENEKRFKAYNRELAAKFAKANKETRKEKPKEKQ